MLPTRVTPAKPVLHPAALLCVARVHCCQPPRAAFLVVSLPTSPMPLLQDVTLGIDFGTSNSAMAVRQGAGLSRMVALEGDAPTLPTALFFNAEDQRTHFGRDAVAQYLAGTEGRLMRSLKSLLGSALLQDKTAVHNQMVSYQDIIGLFLRMLAQKARDALGGMPARVVMGRPVHFVDGDAARDQQAEDALRQAALSAGFENVSFQFEPIAAALDYEQRIDRESLVLVVDIGGGTSDFTVVRLGPERMARADRSSDVLATTGVHIGGTDFDRRLSLDLLMPLLGFRHVGPSGREVPSRVFFDLSTWHLIQWLYSPRALRDAQNLRTDYADAALHARLMRVLNERLGHRLANTVEQAKIAASLADAEAPMPLDWVEAGLSAAVTPPGLAQSLAQPLEQVVACARDCLQLAGLDDGGVNAIYLTGGSSALRPLRQALRTAFPAIPQVEGDLFGGVAAGLAVSR
ncbi:molecular chaperone, HSP70 class [Acidovorax sp. KKS102]|nr:molecular chaperone, HSP70 class [Acidovorax sp. KKS102]